MPGRNRHKVIHIITRLDRGGSAENTLRTCRGLAGRFDLLLVHGLSLESRMTSAEKASVDRRIRAARAAGVRVMALPSLVRRISPLSDLRALVSLWTLIRRERPSLVHTHTSKAGILGRLAAWFARVPFIVHTPHGHVFYGHFGRLVSRCFLVAERAAARITDRMVALTEAEKRDYISYSVLPEKRIITIHSGVDLAPFLSVRVNRDAMMRSLGLNPADLVVGTVGWLLPIKGPDILLRAMALVWPEFPRVSLVFVGKGDMEGELKQAAIRMGVSGKVVFAGWRDDIPEILQVLDVFVLASLNEGMGRVIVEAMASGKPVVASRAGGIQDLVREGETGFLSAPGHAGELGAHILRLLKDPELRRRMGEAGRRTAHEFSAEKMVEKTEALYTALLGGAGTRER